MTIAGVAVDGKILCLYQTSEAEKCLSEPPPRHSQLSIAKSISQRVTTTTRHILRFDIPLSASTASDLRNPDKEQLRADILAMGERGMSYREIGAILDIHWTRVGQILKSVHKASD